MARFLTPSEDRLIAAFLALLEQRLPADALRAVTLFGSRARGDANEHSDLNVAVEVGAGLTPLVARRVVADAALDAIMKRDAFGLGLAPVVVAPNAGGWLAAALARDGERLWPGKA